MLDTYKKIVENMRGILSRILEPRLDLTEFLSTVTRSAKALAPDHLEARVYEVDFIENHMTLRTSTLVDVTGLSEKDRVFTIQPKTITGDAIIENRPVMGSRKEGYADSRFTEGHDVRAAFPIEFHDVDLPEGRTKYVLVVDEKGKGDIPPDILAALKDYCTLAGLAISIKELRDKLSRYYEENRNLVLSGRHSAAIGHDIRSLNVGAGGFLGLAHKRLEGLDHPGIPKIRKYLDMAGDNVRQVEVLLGEFAQFNRRGIVLNRNVDLVDAVAGKIESLKNREDIGRHLDVDLALPDEPCGVYVDPDWFGTVVENIVKNSVEACGGPTRMYINVKCDPDRGVSLIFEDDCGGIPSDVLRDIFTPFKTGRKKGHGLGLANAKKVVDDHGGRIYVTSRAGNGACFTIEFPPPKPSADKRRES